MNSFELQGSARDRRAGTLTSVTAHGSICTWARSAEVGTSSLPGRVTILLDMSTFTATASSAAPRKVLKLIRELEVEGLL